MIFKQKSFRQKSVLNKEFKILLKPTYNDLFKFIFALTKNKVLTDDALQNTLTKAYKNFHQLREKDKFKSWIFTIAKNEVMTMFGKYNERIEVCVEEGLLHNVCIADDTEEILIKEETKLQIINEIKNLKNIYREIIILYYYHDLSLEEIATILQVNASTIRTRHARAKECLYKSLKDLEKEKGCSYETL